MSNLFLVKAYYNEADPANDDPSLAESHVQVQSEERCLQAVGRLGVA
jgi:hypothetical protein